MGIGYWICEIIGMIVWWIFLNIRAVFLKKNNRRYYPFAELWKGRSLDLGGEQPDDRPCTLTGFLIIVVPMLIAIFMRSCS